MNSSVKQYLILSSLLSVIFCQNTGLSGQDKCGYQKDLYRIQFNQSMNWGYGYDSLLIDLENWGTSPYVTIDSLGASVQNRALWELTISENPDSNSGHRVYIHARTHPGEEESFWVTNEIINILLSDTPFAAFVRSNCIFHIVPMYNPDGVELGYARENANGIDIESGWDDSPLEPEVVVLKNRFIELMAADNPVEVALNMHSSYSCTRYFVYHDAAGTSENYTNLEQQFINGIQSYFEGGFQNWDYFISWTSGTPDQYPESWWWITHGENVMALTYEDMNCEQAGAYDSTAYAIVRGICDYIGLNYVGIENENNVIPTGFSLSQNFPNPFNPHTNIRYNVPLNDHVNITVFNLRGHEVKTLFNSTTRSGKGIIHWDGKNSQGEIVPSGIYICSIKAGDFNQSKKMILLK